MLRGFWSLITFECTKYIVPLLNLMVANSKALGIQLSPDFCSFNLILGMFASFLYHPTQKIEDSYCFKKKKSLPVFVC